MDDVRFRYSRKVDMTLRGVVGKALARDRADGGRAPTITQLLLPPKQRSFSREIEGWLEGHDPVTLLESLAAHLLRTLPVSETEEAERWMDGQRGRKGDAAKAVLETEVLRVPSSSHWDDDEEGLVVEKGIWAGLPVMLVTVKALKELGQTSHAKRKAHQHRLACITSTAPFLAPLRHESLLPVYGYMTPLNGYTTIHPEFPQSLYKAFVRRKETASRLRAVEVLRVAADVATALSHLHALGFVHRNVNCRCILPRDPSTEDRIHRVMLGDFSFALRTTRGRVPLSDWLPAAHAPETPHTRFFDWGSDVYGLGMALIEMCYYGDNTAALRAAHSASTSRVKPEEIPQRLWDAVIWPAVQPIADLRITMPALRQAAEELEAWYTADPDSRMDFIPLQQDGVDSPRLSELIRVGVPLNAVRNSTVVCNELRDDGWPQLIATLLQNRSLTRLELISTVLLSDLRVHPDCQLDTLRYIGCGVRTQPELLASLTGNIRNLRCLEIHNTFLGDAAAAALVAALTTTENLPLEHLTLSSVCGARCFGVALVEAAQKSTMTRTVTQLRLGGNSISSSTMSLLACHWFQKSTALAVLDFGYTESLDYFSLAHLAQVVRQSCSLQELCLVGTPISSSGLWLLLSALRSLPAARPVISIDSSLDHSYAADIRHMSCSGLSRC